MIVHEPAPTEAREAEDIPAVEPTAAEDIGHDDNIVDDEFLPQIEHDVVSSPIHTNSELISIGCPLTPTAQDASWADHPQQQDTPSTPQQQQVTPLCKTKKTTLRPSQLHIHRRHQCYAGFAKDQGLKSLFRAFQKEKCTTNLLHVKCFQMPLLL